MTKSKFKHLAVAIVLICVFSQFVCGEEPAVEGCSKCDHGKIACKAHKNSPLPPFKCSICIKLPCGCNSLGWTPCTVATCPWREQSEKEFEERSSALKAWLAASRADLEGKAFADNPRLSKILPIHAENDSFHFAGVLKPAKALYYDEKGREKRKMFDSHELAHLYMTRLELIYARFRRLMGLKKKFMPSMSTHWRIVVWDSEEQQRSASYKICGLSNSNHTLLLPDFFSTWNERGDDFLNAQITHQLAIMLNNDMGRYVFNGIPVWFDEAVAHWIEYSFFEALSIFNEGEVTFNPNCPVKYLKKFVHDEVKKKGTRLPPFSTYIEHDLDELTGYERVKGWSIIDWLFTAWPEGTVAKLNAEYKKSYPEKKNQAICLDAVLGLTYDGIDSKWAEWVLEKYR